MDSINESIEAIFRLYDEHGRGDYIGECVSQTQHMVQCAMLAEAEGCSNEVILGALFHDIGHLIGLEQNLPRMETQGIQLGIQNHEEMGAKFLKEHGLPEITCQMVKGHVDAKRYLVYKDQVYHDGLSDASKMTLVHQGGPMTPQEAQTFESLPAFEGILNMRTWDERAKDPTVEIQPLAKYKLMCRNLLNQYHTQNM
ncbi:2-amino-1-hydroxyethylphosphonate dioxygenase (glycine-forming)-like [Amphiura filiformis]|uniref:2-amino-1-hydroxyethylphosphonate dioxygenase (glycine-forming)-like n=1 Tax=Amphiura filiformis TaxID=82378 RepID=UPI003B2170EB